MAAKPTPAQKAAAKAFVKHVLALEKGAKLPRKEFCALVGLPESTLRSWKKVLPSVDSQRKIRDRIAEKHGTFQTLVSESFAFLAVTATPELCREIKA